MEMLTLVESKEEGKTEKQGSKVGGKTEKPSSKEEGKTERQGSKADVGRNGKTESEAHAAALEEAREAESMPQAVIYVHVDIYL